jgi:hypothetical protein
MKPVAVASLGCALVLAACGGGHQSPGPDRLAGRDVAAMAERELEAENVGMSTGTMTCPDLDFEVGATVRCLRTTELSGGRVVKVRGTVKVTSVGSGGRLHVAMDDEAEEFGLSGAEVAADVGRRYQRRFHVRPDRVDCPYVRGEVGAQATCLVVVAGKKHPVGVRVTAVDREAYRTSYAVSVRPARN